MSSSSSPASGQRVNSNANNTSPSSPSGNAKATGSAGGSNASSRSGSANTAASAASSGQKAQQHQASIQQQQQQNRTSASAQSSGRGAVLSYASAIAKPNAQGNNNINQNSVAGSKSPASPSSPPTTSSFANEQQERLMYVASCLVGLPVIVHCRNKACYEGILHEVKFGQPGLSLTLSYALLANVDKSTAKVSDYQSQLTIQSGDFLQICASNADLLSAKQFVTDADIGAATAPKRERVLEKFDIDHSLSSTSLGLEDDSTSGWSVEAMFKTNKAKFNIDPKFDESLYTTEIPEEIRRNEKLAQYAASKAKEIESGISDSIVIKEDRNQIGQADYDGEGQEERLFSAVLRPEDMASKGANGNAKTAGTGSTNTSPNPGKYVPPSRRKELEQQQQQHQQSPPPHQQQPQHQLQGQSQQSKPEKGAGSETHEVLTSSVSSQQHQESKGIEAHSAGAEKSVSQTSLQKDQKQQEEEAKSENASNSSASAATAVSGAADAVNSSTESSTFSATTSSATPSSASSGKSTFKFNVNAKAFTPTFTPTASAASASSGDAANSNIQHHSPHLPPNQLHQHHPQQHQQHQHFQHHQSHQQHHQPQHPHPHHLLQMQQQQQMPFAAPGANGLPMMGMPFFSGPGHNFNHIPSGTPSFVSQIPPVMLPESEWNQAIMPMEYYMLANQFPRPPMDPSMMPPMQFRPNQPSRPFIPANLPVSPPQPRKQL